MKKLTPLLFLYFIVSCINPCGPVGLYIKIIPEFQGTLINGVNIQFENSIVNSKTTPNPPSVKDANFTFEKDLGGYYGVAYVEYNVKNTNIRLLDWAPLQSILDAYIIKISDPSGQYNDYNTPPLRELIEQSEYKDRKLIVGYDKSGKVIHNELTFTIELQEK